MATDLTEDEIDLIRASFRVVQSVSRGAARSFYRHLFEIAPETRDLFVADLDRQGQSLMSTLGVVVAQLQDFDSLAELLDDLALRHVAYGVKVAQYAPVGDALIAMLAETLDARFSPELETAWRKAYAAVAGQMIRRSDSLI